MCCTRDPRWYRQHNCCCCRCIGPVEGALQQVLVLVHAGNMQQYKAAHASVLELCYSSPNELVPDVSNFQPGHSSPEYPCGSVCHACSTCLNVTFSDFVSSYVVLCISSSRFKPTTSLTTVPKRAVIPTKQNTTSISLQPVPLLLLMHYVLTLPAYWQISYK